MATIQNAPTPNVTAEFKAQLVNSTTLVFHVNLFIYALIAVMTLLRVPHLLALFGTPSQWYKGHLLYYSEPNRPKARVNRHDSSRTLVGRNNSTKTVRSTNEHAGTDDSHTHHHRSPAVDYNRHDHRRHGDKESDHEEIEIKYPPHVPVVPRLLRSILTLSRVRIFEGYSMGQLAILTSYFYALVYATFFKSNPFVDATRPAWVAVSQMPLLFALAQKNSLLGSILGYGYERLNFVHRFAGRMIILASNLHSIYYFYRWTSAGIFKQAIARPKNAWGFVALLCMDLIFIFSTPFWRRKAYNVFLWNHVVCFVILLPAVYLHQRTLLPYVLACVFLYAVDRAMRVLKTRLATATILTIPHLDVTHIEVPSLNTGWRAGQHVRLRVLSRGMGWLGWTEVHPFTIASAPDSQDGLILMCKSAGDWTKRLALLAKGKGYSVGEEESKVKVWIEGPYGGPGRMVFESFSACVLVVGGSGITFGLSVMQDLVAKDLRGESRIKYLELVWVCQDAASITPLVALFISLIQQSVLTPLRISVYYTRAVTSKLPFAHSHAHSSTSPSQSAPDALTHLPMTLHPNLTVTPGRPRVNKALDSAITRAVSLGGGHKESQGITGVAVGVCGPGGLGEDVAKVVGAVEPSRRDQVGGIEIHEETFGW